MQRALLMIVLASVLLAGCSKKPDAPTSPTVVTPTVPPPPQPPTAGSVHVKMNESWRYMGGTNDSPEDVFAHVVAQNDSTFELRTTTTSLTDNSSTSTVSTIDASTLALISLEDGRLGTTLTFDPPLPILIPAADHDYNGSVEVPTPFGVVTQPATGHVSFLGLENVTVPAGSFQAFHYNATFSTAGAFTFEQHTEVWFSPLVKQAVRSIQDGRTQELVSYTVG